jgi:hypothetical protein
VRARAKRKIEMTASEERWRTNSDAGPEGIGKEDNRELKKVKEKDTAL